MQMHIPKYMHLHVHLHVDMPMHVPRSRRTCSSSSPDMTLT